MAEDNYDWSVGDMYRKNKQVPLPPLNAQPKYYSRLGVYIVRVVDAHHRTWLHVTRLGEHGQFTKEEEQVFKDLVAVRYG